MRAFLTPNVLSYFHTLHLIQLRLRNLAIGYSFRPVLSEVLAWRDLVIDFVVVFPGTERAGMCKLAHIFVSQVNIFMDMPSRDSSIGPNEMKDHVVGGQTRWRCCTRSGG